MLSTLDFNKMADLFEGYVNGDEPENPTEPEREFLIALGYLDKECKPVETRVWPLLPDLIRHADTLDRIFAMPIPTMPGLYFFGAQRRDRSRALAKATEDAHIVANYGGSGTTPNEAFERCLGEAVEHFASLSIEPQNQLVRSSSTGFASGRTLANAQNSAANECLERDDLARWFLSGAPLLALQPDEPLNSIAGSLRRSRKPEIRFLLVQNEASRHHTVIAVSKFSGELVTGYGCSANIHEACLKAACELGQGELGVQFERQQQTPPPNGFLARSRHFQTMRHLLEPAASTRPYKSYQGSDHGTADYQHSFTFSDITCADINIPCVVARNAKLRDVILEVNEGEVGPL